MSETPRPTLYQALLLALAEMGPVVKNATNPGFRSKYADLPGVLETITPALHKHGLLVLQRLGTGAEGETPVLITEVIHAATGDKVQSMIPVASKDPSDPQKFGSALTYYRRYSLLALLGLAPEDDDGNAASQPAQRTQHAQARPQREPLNAAPVGAPYNDAEHTRLAQQVRRNDDALAPAAYDRFHELERLRKATPRPLNAPSASPQPRTAPEAAAAASQAAMPAPAPLTDAEYARLFEQAWTLVEDGRPYLDVVACVKRSRDRMTDAQFDASRDEVRLIRKAIDARDQDVPKPASVAGAV